MKHKLKQLAVFDTPDSDGSGKITIHPFSLGGATYHSWQKQERFKGRASDFVSGFGGTSDMGWGFSQMGVWSQGIPPMYNALYVGNQFVMDHVRTNAYTLAQANAASDAQLISDPVFMHILTLGVPTSTMSQAERNVFLARGIPALSTPMGSGSVHELSGIAFKDLNVYSLDPNWPRDGDWDGWRHGDIKAIAFPFVQELFLDVLGAMSDE